MRPLLAIAGLVLVAALGFAVIWGYSSPEPGWAQAELRRTPLVDAANLHFSNPLARLRLGGAAATAVPQPQPGAAIAEAGTSDPTRVAPPFDGLRLPAGAFEVARGAEALRLEAEEDGEGGWIVGYGHRLREQPERAVTADEAEEMLREDLAAAEEAVKSSVGIPLNQNEYGALVEFARSIGADNFSHTLVATLLNAGDREAAADAFMLWTKVRVDGALVDSAELVTQRERTQALFLGRPTG